jgi:ubiquinone biosynthesis protein Coq4
MDNRQSAATPHNKLIEQLMDSRISKNEREYTAARELTTFRSLVLNYAGQTLAVVMLALHQRLPDEHLAAIKRILNRPEVREIIEEKP